jgi:hypothetical protein
VFFKKIQLPIKTKLEFMNNIADHLLIQMQHLIFPTASPRTLPNSMFTGQTLALSRKKAPHTLWVARLIAKKRCRSTLA